MSWRPRLRFYVSHLLLPFAALSALKALAANLSPTEERLAQNVEARFAGSSHAKQFFIDTVNTNSGTLNKAGVKAVAAQYRTRLQALGFDVSEIDLSSVKRAVHLFARHSGFPKKGPRLLLIGHMDTVFEPDSHFLHFKDLGDGTIEGPGVSDMKGGNFVMLEALEALRDAGLLKTMTITVALMGDEEAVAHDSDGSSKTSRSPLIEAAQNSDIALAFEPESYEDPGPATSRRGNSGWTLTVKAKPGHSSRIFTKDMGPGAVFPAAQILEHFYRDLRGEEMVSFNVGNLLAGTFVDLADKVSDVWQVKGKRNVIPVEARAGGDLRTLSPESLTNVRAKMRRIVELEVTQINKDYARDARVSAEISFRDSYPPMPATAENIALMKKLSQANADLGYGPLKAADPRSGGAADISFVAGHVKAALDGLGPMGSGIHTTREHTDWKSLSSATQRAAILLYRLAGEARPDQNPL